MDSQNSASILTDGVFSITSKHIFLSTFWSSVHTKCISRRSCFNINVPWCGCLKGLEVLSRSHFLLHSSNWKSCSDKRLEAKPCLGWTSCFGHWQQSSLFETHSPEGVCTIIINYFALQYNTNSKYSKCIITIIIVTATKIIHRYFNWKGDFSSLNSFLARGLGLGKNQ